MSTYIETYARLICEEMIIRALERLGATDIDVRLNDGLLTFRLRGMYFRGEKTRNSTYEFYDEHDSYRFREVVHDLSDQYETECTKMLEEVEAAQQKQLEQQEARQLAEREREAHERRLNEQAALDAEFAKATAAVEEMRGMLTALHEQNKINAEQRADRERERKLRELELHSQMAALRKSMEQAKDDQARELLRLKEQEHLEAAKMERERELRQAELDQQKHDAEQAALARQQALYDEAREARLNRLEMEASERDAARLRALEKAERDAQTAETNAKELAQEAMRIRLLHEQAIRFSNEATKKAIEEAASRGQAQKVSDSRGMQNNRMTSHIRFIKRVRN